MTGGVIKFMTPGDIDGGREGGEDIIEDDTVCSEQS